MRNIIRRSSNTVRQCVKEAKITNKREFFTTIHQGNEGYRLFLGKNPVKLDPGIHWAFPLIHTVMKVDMREGSIGIEKLNAYTKDNVSVLISGSLFYKVTDSYNSCFKVQDYRKIMNIGNEKCCGIVPL